MLFIGDVNMRHQWYGRGQYPETDDRENMKRKGNAINITRVL